MKFLADHDVFAATVRRLRDLGHDLVTAGELGMATAKDRELLTTAIGQDRIFITRDRDYGNLVFVESIEGGVFYLRLLPRTLNSVHHELERVLDLYDESVLSTAFTIIEPGRHRIRRRPTSQP